MQFRQTESGYEDLRLKVLDMGQGQERAAWFCQGKSTSFETTFPTVTEKLYRRTGISPEPELIARFLPYASYLNVDEVSDIEKTQEREITSQRVTPSASSICGTLHPSMAIFQRVKSGKGWTEAPAALFVLMQASVDSL